MRRLVQKLSKSELQTFRKKPEETEVIKVIKEINQGNIVELKDITVFRLKGPIRCSVQWLMIEPHNKAHVVKFKN